MQIKYLLRVYTAFAVFLLFGAALPAFAGDKKASGNKAARVNGIVITMKEFNREMRQVQQRLYSRERKDSKLQLSELKKDVLENLINRELLYQETHKHKTPIEESAVTEQLNGLKKRFPSQSEYKNALQKMNLSELEIRTKLKKELGLKHFVDKQFSQKVSVAGKEAKAYYDDHPNFFKQPEQVRASHILIKLDPKATESQKTDARRQLEKIQQRLDTGEDFGSLAKAFSQGPSNARNGDLGYFRRGQMVKPFEDVAFGLKPGEVSAIVKTGFGYHLIKVVDKKPETKVTYEKAKNRIQQYLKQDKIKKHIDQLVEKLKQNAVVERYL